VLIRELAKFLDADLDELPLLAEIVPDRIMKRVLVRPDAFRHLAELKDRELDALRPSALCGPRRISEWPFLFCPLITLPSRLLRIDNGQPLEQGDVAESLVGADEAIDRGGHLNRQSHRELNRVEGVDLPRLPVLRDEVTSDSK